jgi:hypothetical protein
MIFYAAHIRYEFFRVALSISECCCKQIRYCYWKRTTHHAAYYHRLASYFKMAELALVDYFVMGEAISIVATLSVSFYYSRKQMQKQFE